MSLVSEDTEGNFVEGCRDRDAASSFPTEKLTHELSRVLDSLREPRAGVEYNQDGSVKIVKESDHFQKEGVGAIDKEDAKWKKRRVLLRQLFGVILNGDQQSQVTVLLGKLKKELQAGRKKKGECFAGILLGTEEVDELGLKGLIEVYKDQRCDVAWRRIINSIMSLFEQRRVLNTLKNGLHDWLTHQGIEQGDIYRSMGDSANMDQEEFERKIEEKQCKVRVLKGLLDNFETGAIFILEHSLEWLDVLNTTFSDCLNGITRISQEDFRKRDPLQSLITSCLQALNKCLSVLKVQLRDALLVDSKQSKALCAKFVHICDICLEVFVASDGDGRDVPSFNEGLYNLMAMVLCNTCLVFSLSPCCVELFLKVKLGFPKALFTEGNGFCDCMLLKKLNMSKGGEVLDFSKSSQRTKVVLIHALLAVIGSEILFIGVPRKTVSPSSDLERAWSSGFFFGYLLDQLCCVCTNIQALYGGTSKRLAVQSIANWVKCCRGFMSGKESTLKRVSRENEGKDRVALEVNQLVNVAIARVGTGTTFFKNVLDLIFLNWSSVVPNVGNDVRMLFKELISLYSGGSFQRNAEDTCPREIHDLVKLIDSKAEAKVLLQCYSVVLTEVGFDKAEKFNLDILTFTSKGVLLIPEAVKPACTLLISCAKMLRKKCRKDYELQKDCVGTLCSFDDYFFQEWCRIWYKDVSWAMVYGEEANSVSGSSNLLVETLLSKLFTLDHILACNLLVKLLSSRDDEVSRDGNCLKARIEVLSSFNSIRNLYIFGDCPVASLKENNNFIGQARLLVSRGCMDEDPSVRLRALSMVCTGFKSSDVVSEGEISIIKAVITFALLKQSAESFDGLDKIVRNGITRIKNRVAVTVRDLKKRPDDSLTMFEQTRCIDFFLWTCNTCTSYLQLAHMGCARQFASTALEAVYSCGNELENDVQQAVIFARDSSEKDALRKLNSLWSSCAWDTFVERLDDGEPSIKSRVFKILCLPGWKSSIDETKMKKLLVLVRESVRSVKITDHETACISASLLCMHFDLNAEQNTVLSHFQTLAIDLQSIIEVPLYSGEEAIVCSRYLFLAAVCVEALKVEVECSSRDILGASKNHPVHGSLLLVNHLMKSILKELPKIFTCQEECDSIMSQVGTVFKTTLPIVLRSSEIAMVVVSNESPEGFVPGINDKVVVKYSDAQAVLYLCWHTIERSARFLNLICEFNQTFCKGMAGKRLMETDCVELIGCILIFFLTKARHIGATECCASELEEYCKVYYGTEQWKSWVGEPLIAKVFLESLVVSHFSDFQERLDSLGITSYHSSEDFVLAPQSWLDSIVKVLKSSDYTSVSFTRRGAGLGHAVHALLLGSRYLKSEGVYEKCISEVFHSLLTTHIKKVDGKQKEGLLNTSRVHNLNILRRLFRDNTISDHGASFLESGMIFCVHSLQSADWYERNAANLLFSVLINRVFGSDAGLAVKRKVFCLSLRQFLADYPVLCEELISILHDIAFKRACADSVGYFILVLLNKLGYGDAVVEPTYCVFVERLTAVLGMFCSSPIMGCRKLSSSIKSSLEQSMPVESNCSSNSVCEYLISMLSTGKQSNNSVDGFLMRAAFVFRKEYSKEKCNFRNVYADHRRTIEKLLLMTSREIGGDSSYRFLLLVDSLLVMEHRTDFAQFSVFSMKSRECEDGERASGFVTMLTEYLINMMTQAGDLCKGAVGVRKHLGQEMAFLLLLKCACIDIQRRREAEVRETFERVWQYLLMEVTSKFETMTFRFHWCRWVCDWYLGTTSNFLVTPAEYSLFCNSNTKFLEPFEAHSYLNNSCQNWSENEVDKIWSLLRDMKQDLLVNPLLKKAYCASLCCVLQMTDSLKEDNLKSFLGDSLAILERDCMGGIQRNESMYPQFLVCGRAIRAHILNGWELDVELVEMLLDIGFNEVAKVEPDSHGCSFIAFSVLEWCEHIFEPNSESGRLLWKLKAKILLLICRVYLSYEGGRWFHEKLIKICCLLPRTGSEVSKMFEDKAGVLVNEMGSDSSPSSYSLALFEKVFYAFITSSSITPMETCVELLITELSRTFRYVEGYKDGESNNLFAQECAGFPWRTPFNVCKKYLAMFCRHENTDQVIMVYERVYHHIVTMVNDITSKNMQSQDEAKIHIFLLLQILDTVAQSIMEQKRLTNSAHVEELKRQFRA
eukprot:Nk52_evm9s270 gene=Nk52_evmTU9s270